MILALDPSTSCTGYAVLTDAGAVVWEQTGTIRPKGEDLPEKLLDLARDVAGLFKTFRMGDDSTIVIERPQTAGGPNRGTYGKQSPMSIAAYGAAFGAVYTMVCRYADPMQILTPTPMEWVGRGCIPSSQGDPHKEKRVRWVEQIYGLPHGHLGCKSKAGNVADAILLARWGLTARQYRKIG